MRARRAAGLVAVAALLGGCAAAPPAAAPPAAAPPPAIRPPPTPAVPAPSDARPGLTGFVPARLATGMADACLAQIEAFAAERTGSRVILGPGAFATSHELVLTRMPRRGPDGRPLDGKAAQPEPVVLHLLAGADGCVVRAVAPAAPPGSPARPAGAAEMAVPDCRCTPVERR